MNDVKISRLISYILRHNPESIGISLDNGGWVNVNHFLAMMNKKVQNFNFYDLARIVNNDNKQRYEFNQDKSKIRACYGHSVIVNLELEGRYPNTPTLYHGTTEKNVASIATNGILKMNRQYVHLSQDIGMAIKVGRRHGNPIVLTVNVFDMYYDGYIFYYTKSGVWLTEHVPVKYINIKGVDLY